MKITEEDISIYNNKDIELINEAFKFINNKNLSEEFLNQIQDKTQGVQCLMFLQEENNKIKILFHKNKYSIKIFKNKELSIKSMIDNWNNLMSGWRIG